MKHTIFLAFALASASPVFAQSAMNGAEFDAYTVGKTLFYGENGKLYGVERYLPDRRVIWSFLDGRCKDGTWYEANDQICFVYDDPDAPQCWTFRRTATGLSAQFENDPTATELYEAQEVDEEMICFGPDVGM